MNGTILCAISLGRALVVPRQAVVGEDLPRGDRADERVSLGLAVVVETEGAEPYARGLRLGQPPPKRFEPQKEQKLFADPPSGVYDVRRSAPSSTRIASVCTRPLTVPYPPEIPLQNVQWHCDVRTNGSVTSNRTPPQRQLPWSGVTGAA